MNSEQIDLIGAVFGWGGKNPRNAFGSEYLKNYASLQQILAQYSVQWRRLLYARTPFEPGKDLNYSERIQEVSWFNSKLANELACVLEENHFPVVVGGDHSIAMGTWSGVVSELEAYQNFGLIWMDAHLDAHTPQTTESNAICGMPVAALLGCGESLFTNICSDRPKLSPLHVVYIGVRSFEQGEAKLVKDLNITVYDMNKIEALGFEKVWQLALDQVMCAPKGFGVSIDLDVFDPRFAPGVNYPEQNGLNPQQVLKALSQLKKNIHFKGLEIAEFNPSLDSENKTADLVSAIIKNIL